MSQPERSSTFRTRLANTLPAWLVLAIALCCTLIGWRVGDAHQRDSARQHLALRSEQMERTIRTRMLNYEALLSGGVGLFDAVGEVDRRQWRSYVDFLDLEIRFPGILGMGYTARIAPEELEAHQRRIRAEGFPQYVVTPVGTRDEYHSIVYLEPFTGRNLRAFGYDMHSDPVRRKAMDLARDTGLPALSGKVTLVQETDLDTQAGCLIYVPVYRSGMPTATIAQRRAALKGFVYAPFRMADLVRGILGNQFPELALQIYDGDSLSPETLLFDSNASMPPERSTPLFSQTRPFELNQHAWTLRVWSQPQFELPGDNSRLGSVLLGGLTISLLLFAITWNVVTTRARAKALAMEMTKALRDSEARLRAIHDHAAFGIVQTTPEGTITHTNPAFRNMLGYSEAELNDMHWTQVTLPEDQAENQSCRKELLQGLRDGYTLEKRYVCKDGRIVWGNLAVTVVRGEDGQPEFLVALIEDITTRRHQQEEITFQAFHDALTGLPNRMLFSDRLDQAIVKARRDQTAMALIFLDLDHFKEVNDALGHAAGDGVLQEVARRLRGCVRSSDTVARIGGDEFTVLLPVVDGPKGAIQVARKLLQTVPVTLMIDGKPLTVTTSIGISLYPDHAQDAETLIKRADQAMYTAKQNGKNRYMLYSPVPGDAPRPIGSRTR